MSEGDIMIDSGADVLKFLRKEGIQVSEENLQLDSQDGATEQADERHKTTKVDMRKLERR